MPCCDVPCRDVACREVPCRGVACGEVLRGLLDRRLVRIVGRAEELGRPMLYGTTKEFLQTFGLGSLKDLPKSEDL